MDAHQESLRTNLAAAALRVRAAQTGRTVKQVIDDDRTLSIHMDHLQYGDGPCPCTDCAWERERAEA